MRDEMGSEVDIDVAHGDHLAGVVQTTLDFDVGQRGIPGEINLMFDKGLDEGVIVRVEHPVEIDTVLAKVCLQSPKYADVGRRCRPAKSHHIITSSLGQDVTWEQVTMYKQDREVIHRTQIEKIDY